MMIALFLTWLLLFAIMICLGIIFLWYVRPDLLVKWTIQFKFRRSGMRQRTVKGQTLEYVYAERGVMQPDKTSLFFLHGFSASKDMWSAVVQRLPSDLHIIALDLPGHGDSAIPGEDVDLSVMSLVEYVYEFTELVGLTKKPFHLVGTSLGGVIATVYAATFGSKVERATLICPAFRTPVLCDFMKELTEGKLVLVPTTVDELRHMLESCYYNRNVIPMHPQILKGILSLREPKNPFYIRMLRVMIRDLNDREVYEQLEVDSTRITCPVQLIWGKHDKVIHVSGVEHLKSLMPNIERTDVIDKCGHSAGIEKAGLVSRLILDFRDNSTSSKKRD